MGGIITRQKLVRLRDEIDGLRAKKNNIKPDELVRLATQLGREKSKKGKHPTYENPLLPTRNPVSIPGHPTIKAMTAMSVLDELDADIDEFFEALEAQERAKNANRKQLPSATVHQDFDT